MRLTDLLALTHVPRWSIVALARPQTVAEHTYRVAVIYVDLCERLGTFPTLSGLRYALTHDAPEARSGDIPQPFKGTIAETLPEAEKRAVPWAGLEPSPTAFDKTLVKVADYVEAITYAERWGVGPHSGREAQKLRGYLSRFASEHSVPVMAVNALIQDIMEERGR